MRKARVVMIDGLGEVLAVPWSGNEDQMVEVLSQNKRHNPAFSFAADVWDKPSQKQKPRWLRLLTTGLNTDLQERWNRNEVSALMDESLHGFWEEKISAWFENVKARGKGKWFARCPSHDDEHGSLSLSVGRNGDLVLNCFGGCQTPDVLSQARLKFPDLAYNWDGKPRGKAGMSDILKIWDFRDERGVLLFQEVRFVPKRFCYRRPDPKDPAKFLWNLDDTRVVLLNLPEIVNTKRMVYVVEGPKKVDALAERGFLATCNPGGAGMGWRGSYSQSLIGCGGVTILPDNDDPGIRHAWTVFGALAWAGVQPLRILYLPDLTDGEDIYDWFFKGHSADELKELTRKTPSWSPK